MAEIISIVNQKGGVGKTTTAVNLGAYLAEHGKFVLLVDLDPQANASSGLGVNYTDLDKGIYQALIGTHLVREIVMPTGIHGYRVAPATPSLAGANIELVDIARREFRLSDALLEVKADYDIILIDCPPSLGILTINGLVAADHILIPVQAEYYALEGLSQLINTIGLVRDNIKPELNILGAIITMFDKRTKLSGQVMEELYKYFPDKIFRSIVPRNVRLSEAPSHGMPISKYDPSSKGAKAYSKLAREVIEIFLQKEI
ncbi:chromosome partitioning protein ParA [Candidatus Falkowbacteria bacterium RIFOXYD2_FULL_35_9]|uniref:Chromosome partitioning protein ParA n=1 Tax=Candidatus Falkowbacteria bacterium RIFOXYC2_FULL_36_12 TaxID=1798002 RepID=A0A1F5SZH5_9BACT|nr:MAG: chromosome partitioning protein ParA [Candidatus Falkowbacteria bacterium RIFOXYB2_FULL_35_7]OGF31896.1 MAG: chromosome partitioning protein ParA [Candidatus Falkowbacteria bacterium RIFOXYC2_FULL_36_12]OGF34001.1 MAG: chromosome partitioning protein ParA [Candidatus Falkowbacteria bacterium RIFOXYA2_FULL_35_8]OGF47717.1 MAG: chromosome partitioning protein ParA [Candidatus Falkowbacteria bacterium RIFOXYD2_FULL_35_9]